MNAVLVEVYDHPEYNPSLQRYGEDKKGEQKRIAACRTGPDGKFCFRGLSRGKYDLRASKVDYNFTSTMLTLNPKNPKSSNKSIKVQLQVGT